MNKILILTGGPVKKLDPFIEPAKELGLDITLASFYDLEFSSESKRFLPALKGKTLTKFDLIYIRMVGKRLEDATLVVNYAKENGIKLVDRIYESALFIPSTISKAVEMKKLIEGGIPLPAIYFGSLVMIRKKAGEILGFPYILKSTSGKKARDTWKIDGDFEAIFSELREREKTGIRFFAQKLVRASQRIRVLVVGQKVIGAITRPTKWRRHFLDPKLPNNPNIPEGKKEAFIPVPEKYSELAIKATNAVGLDIAGVDILEEDANSRLYVIEANAAPSWKLIAKDCGVNVEKEILKFLSSLGVEKA